MINKPLSREETTIVKRRLEEIEKKLNEALVDEEQAASFYDLLKKDIEITKSMNPPQERGHDYLYAMQTGITEIMGQELKHKERITNMLRATGELKRSLEMALAALKPEKVGGEVTIGGLTYLRDDIKKEFRIVGHPDQRISFREYEKKYFDDQRTLRIHFSGNVATMQSSHSGGYKTTNQENAVQAIAFWILTGVLKPGEAMESEREREGRGEANWLEIFKASGNFHIADNHNQDLSTEDAQKAVRAVSSWVYGGQLKG